MQPLAVRHYINTQMSGEQGVWPLEWFRECLAGRTFRRALSVGCGTGRFERSLVELGIAETVDGFDASFASIARARREARDANMQSRIRYFVSDFNRPTLPKSTYDAVFFHQSLHHVAKLEKLLRATLRTIKRDGLVYLEEYVGPSRHDWTEELLEPYDQLYQHFPESTRWFNYVPFPIEWNDPSEAVRSGEIVSALSVGFHVDEFRGYGGNVLGVLYPALVLEEITPSAVDWLIARDREAIEGGQKHFHAVVVARPRGGVRRSLAMIRYYVEPKMKWLGRSLRNRLISRPPVIRKPRYLLHDPKKP